MKKTKKILLVEDDEGFRKAINDSFEDTEFLIIAAVDGEEGLAKARQERPDLILMDILLPRLDGIEAARKLKQSGSRIPIVFLTNVKNDDRISEAMTVMEGETDYIVKTDVKVEDIIDRIRRRLNLK